MMVVRRGCRRQAAATSARPPHWWRPHQLCNAQTRNDYSPGTFSAVSTAVSGIAREGRSESSEREALARKLQVCSHRTARTRDEKLKRTGTRRERRTEVQTIATNAR